MSEPDEGGHVICSLMSRWHRDTSLLLSCGPSTASDRTGQDEEQRLMGHGTQSKEDERKTFFFYPQERTVREKGGGSSSQNRRSGASRVSNSDQSDERIRSFF